MMNRVSNPFTIAVYFSRGTSNHPQRRGRPVTAPNSLPSRRSRSPVASLLSVGNGPEPTRVLYAFETPMMPEIRVGGTPVPMDAPPAEALEDVTNGYVPWSISSIV